MPKILILSCGTGGGHNSAAMAITDYYKEHNISAEFKEYLNIVNPKIEKAVNKLYISSTKRNGKVFKHAYKLGEIYDKTKIKSPVYTLNKLSKKKLYSYIKSHHIDYVITTHLFAAHALTAIKKEHDIHFIEVATDYRCIPFWKETNPDYIIVPHKDLIDEFLKKGFKKEKIKPFGIPVSTRFSEEYSKEKLLKELGLDNQKKYILIMTGSMGFGNMEKLTKKLEEKLPQNVMLIISCGKNEKMRSVLNEKHKNNKKIIILPYTKEVYKYMKISEMILTKPGGLTTTEAAVANVPIIHTTPIPGCENYNANFFKKKGMSLKPKNDDELVNDTINLLTDSKLQEKIKENQRANIDKLAVEKICEFVLDEIKIV